MAFNDLLQTIGARRLLSNPIQAWRFFARMREFPSDHEFQCRFRYNRRPFVARPTDWCAVDEICFGDEYGFLLPLIRDVNKPLIIDAGANIGLFGIWVLSNNPSCRLLSIEASASTFQVLDQNRQLNSDCDWETKHAAIWREDGTVAFADREFSTSSRISSDEPNLPHVPALSLHSLLGLFPDQRVHLLKLDIEGAEESVVPASQAVWKSVDHLVIEIHTNLCPAGPIVAGLRSAFPLIYAAPRVHSAKPLLLATRQPYSLPEYKDA